MKGRGGAGRGQGRKAIFQGVDKADLSRMRIPLAIRESAQRLLKELWDQKLIGADSRTTEDLIAVLQGQKLVIFDDSRIPATFNLSENEADNYEVLNIVEYFGQQKASSAHRLFAIEVTGDSMTNAAIYPRDVLIVEYVDGAIKPRDQDIIVARFQGSPTVKRYVRADNQDFLTPESSNVEHKPIAIQADDDFHVIGIVRYVIHNPRNRY
ncbi:MAG: S24 family peptidase [Cyanobacteria bacterium P01_D01_bin.56]